MVQLGVRDQHQLLALDPPERRLNEKQEQLARCRLIELGARVRHAVVQGVDLRL